jgi:rhodanese-related sulfurtransferase
MSQPFEMDVSALKQRLDSGEAMIVLDVREPWEIEIASIPDTVSIPLGAIAARFRELPADLPIAVLCHHGGRSAQATAWLRSQGFDRATNVAGGIDAWSRLVDPSVPRY